MTRPGGGRRVLATVGALVLAALAGCGALDAAAGGDGDGSDGSSSDGAMAERMFEADWALDGTVEALVDADYGVEQLTARFEACDDGSYRYVFRLRVLAHGGGSFEAAAVEALSDELSTAGWDNVEAGTEATTPLTASGFEFADVSLVVGTSPDGGPVTLAMATECAGATDDEVAFFEAMGEWEPVRRLPDSSAPPTTSSG